jgi:hypothetical protein
LHSSIVYQSSFPICHAPRTSSASQGQERRVQFVFEPKRAIAWSGYKDKPEKTVSGQKITGDVWLAGADPGAMVLGVSFSSSTSIYMNSLHIAYPDRRATSEIAPGLTVTTTPTK